jgi:hypothetical protein
MFPDEFYEYLRQNTLVGIKGGMTPHDFLEIWIVEVDRRIFARSWNRSKKSWFTAFLKSGKGQIRYLDTILNVTGQKVEADNPINKRISKAYLEKYVQPENLKYAIGISGVEYHDYCMEFQFISSDHIK